MQVAGEQAHVRRAALPEAARQYLREMLWLSIRTRSKEKNAGVVLARSRLIREPLMDVISPPFRKG